MQIIKHYKLWFLISGILIIPGIIAWIVWGLNLGIDFKGGTITTVKPVQKTTAAQIITMLKPLSLKDIEVQPVGQDQYQIRTMTTGEKLDLNIKQALTPKGSKTTADVVSFESIGPSISQGLVRNAFLAVIIASLAIILYIAFSFRKVPKPANSWRFGVCAVAALIHDVLFVVGIFAILGHFFGYEINTLFITALLTVMGFSVHDTIVVFDRIRENLRLSPSKAFGENVNDSIIQTFARSLNTSLTVLIVLLSMFWLGGASIKQFVLALLVGIFIGTYSSIFNASQLLVVWQNISSRRQAAAAAAATK